MARPNAGFSSTANLGEAREVRLDRGVLRYRESGAGEPVVFIHGLLVHGGLWRNVAPRLSEGFRCIVPDLPLGSHEVPMDPGADLGVAGLAELIADFLDALELEGVTLVGNDTGGALCQSVVASYPRRIKRLVLTNCDTAGNFPPLLLWPFVWGARVPGFVSLVSAFLRARALQRAFFGLVSKRVPEQRVVESYLAPSLTDAAIRRDLRKVLLGISPKHMLAVEERLPDFDGPVLLAWASEDKVFPVKYARRLKTQFPDARLREVPDARTFIPEDQPQLLVELIRDFLQPRTNAAR